MTAAAANDAGNAENGSALYCQPGGATLTFTASNEGRALCTHDVELSRDLHRPLDAARPAADCDGLTPHALTEQELLAQDQEELDKAEQRAPSSTGTSDSEYDPERPYS
eukprot:5301262-Pleurochrysis_carterae.AAC.1